jgi:hypothetical protein
VGGGGGITRGGSDQSSTGRDIEFQKM